MSIPAVLADFNNIDETRRLFVSKTAFSRANIDPVVGTVVKVVDTDCLEKYSGTVIRVGERVVLRVDWEEPV